MKTIKKIMIALLLFLTLNKVFAGHVGPSTDESYLLVIIPVLILIITWLVVFIRKQLASSKAKIAASAIEQSDEMKPDNEIPEFFVEKDVFGLDKHQQ